MASLGFLEEPIRSLIETALVAKFLETGVVTVIDHELLCLHSLFLGYLTSWVVGA